MHPRYQGLGFLIRGICHYTLIHSFHITYRYIDPSRHNFENCLIHDLSLELLGSAFGFAKGALRNKLWKETNFKINSQ